MLTDLQKAKVQALVKAAIKTIESWDPLEKCELAIRAALAVAKYPENEEFRDFAEGYLRKAIEKGEIQREAQIIQARNGDCLDAHERLYDNWDIARNTDKAWAYLSIDNALSAVRSLKHEKKQLDRYVDACLLYAKLCAIERGEELLITDIIIDINGHKLLQ